MKNKNRAGRFIFCLFGTLLFSIVPLHYSPDYETVKVIFLGCLMFSAAILIGDNE